MATMPQSSSSVFSEGSYVDATEAAKFLSIHPRTLLRMARDVLCPRIHLAMDSGINGDFFFRS